MECAHAFKCHTLEHIFQCSCEVQLTANPGCPNCKKPKTIMLFQTGPDSFSGSCNNCKFKAEEANSEFWSLVKPDAIKWEFVPITKTKCMFVPSTAGNSWDKVKVVEIKADLTKAGWVYDYTSAADYEFWEYTGPL
jgi:hypothetical protein